MTSCAQTAGLAHRVVSGETPSTQLLEVKGGAVALIDGDRDGDLDVFVPGGASLTDTEQGQGARYFENMGGLRFVDRTSSSGLGLKRWSFGCAVADMDGDGHDDVFVTCFGQNVLVRGRGENRFMEMGPETGMPHERWSTAACWGDLDGDGDLDLYVANYVQFDPANPPGPMNFRGASVFGGPVGLLAESDEVYENLGEGRFREVSEAWGFTSVDPAYGLGVSILDVDGDGQVEVLVANDSGGNFLFARGDDGLYRDEGQRAGVAFDENGWGQASMGLAVGDVNGDQLPDVFSTNFMADPNTLHLNLGGRRFEDASRRWGLAMESMPHLGWSCAFVDLDLNGAEEIIVFNGHVYPESITEPMGWEHRQVPLLFERAGVGFQRVHPGSDNSWLKTRHCDRGAVFADLDGDGDVDVLVAELNGPLRLLRNDAEPGNWSSVKLVDETGTGMNRSGLGARVVLEAGGLSQTRWMAGGLSYQGASPPQAHFGLGSYAGRLTVRVNWPGGHEQVFESLEPNRPLVLNRSDP